MSWICMDAISLTQCCFTLKGNVSEEQTRPSMESPLRLTAHGGFGEGDGETRLSKGRKVRPVPTLRSGGGGREAPAYHNAADAAIETFVEEFHAFEGSGLCVASLCQSRGG